MSNKSLVFISHIGEEKEVALAFKELIEESFLGMLDVFVSSDSNSLKMGTKWLDDISDALKRCVVEIVICSPQSVKRPWINFEAGAGWVRDIPVIPLCHSGLGPSDLPQPLCMLQAAKVSDVNGLRSILPVLASALESAVPSVDFTHFIASMVEFEEQYTFWDWCNESCRTIDSIVPGLVAQMKDNQNISAQLTETKIGELEKIFVGFEERNIFKFKRAAGTMMNGEGVFHRCEFIKLGEADTVFADERFKL